MPLDVNTINHTSPMFSPLAYSRKCVRVSNNRAHARSLQAMLCMGDQPSRLKIIYQRLVSGHHADTGLLFSTNTPSLRHAAGKLAEFSKRRKYLFAPLQPPPTRTRPPPLRPSPASSHPAAASLAAFAFPWLLNPPTW